MRWRRAILAGCVLGFTSVFAGLDIELDSDKLNPSARCGGCHQEIYAMWRRSMHSSSISDPVFQASYDRAYRATSGKAREICLRCHAPVAVQTGDLDLTSDLGREGITCDYCHSVVSVNLEQPQNPIRISIDGFKRGPLRHAASPAHEVKRSDLHLTSEFCAGCHEYVNGRGLPVLTTYSEWRQSPQAAGGKTCQHCHMPLTPGDTVPSSLAPSRGMINLHDLSGGHSNEQVRKAATVRILGVKRNPGDEVQVDVEVANIGSGHRIPTGMPTRKLVLEVTLLVDGREVTHFEREYQKKLLNERGDLILEDHETMLDATAVLEDNRIAPGEKRVEKFRAVVLPKGTLHAEAILRYLYKPKLLIPQEMSIEMASDRSP